MEQPRRYVFRGNASGVAAHIRRPVDLLLPVQAASSLPTTGGLSESRVGPTKWGERKATKGNKATYDQAKGKGWQDSHIVHHAEVSGPFPNENRFAVRFVFDVTDKPTGKRTTHWDNSSVSRPPGKNRSPCANPAM